MSGTVPSDFNVTGVEHEHHPAGRRARSAHDRCRRREIQRHDHGQRQHHAHQSGQRPQRRHIQSAGNVDIVANGALGANGSATGNVTLTAARRPDLRSTTTSPARTSTSPASASKTSPARRRSTCRPAAASPSIRATSRRTASARSASALPPAASTMSSTAAITGVAPTTRQRAVHEPDRIDHAAQCRQPADHEGLRRHAEFHVHADRHGIERRSQRGLAGALDPRPRIRSSATARSSTRTPARQGADGRLSNNTQAVSPSLNGAVLYGLQFAGYAAPPARTCRYAGQRDLADHGQADHLDRHRRRRPRLRRDHRGGPQHQRRGAERHDRRRQREPRLSGTATGTLVNKNVGVNKAVDGQRPDADRHRCRQLHRQRCERRHGHDHAAGHHVERLHRRRSRLQRHESGGGQRQRCRAHRRDRRRQRQRRRRRRTGTVGEQERRQRQGGDRHRRRSRRHRCRQLQRHRRERRDREHHAARHHLDRHHRRRPHLRRDHRGRRQHRRGGAQRHDRRRQHLARGGRRHRLDRQQECRHGQAGDGRGARPRRHRCRELHPHRCQQRHGQHFAADGSGHRHHRRQSPRERQHDRRPQHCGRRRDRRPAGRHRGSRCERCRRSVATPGPGRPSRSPSPASR